MIAELGLSSQLVIYITLCTSLCFNDSMFCVSDKNSGDYQSQCLNKTFTLTDLLCVLLIFYTIIIFILSLLYNGKAGEGESTAVWFPSNLLTNAILSFMYPWNFYHQTMWSQHTPVISYYTNVTITIYHCFICDYIRHEFVGFHHQLLHFIPYRMKIYREFKLADSDWSNWRG